VELDFVSEVVPASVTDELPVASVAVDDVDCVLVVGESFRFADSAIATALLHSVSGLLP
jgi:hypothetical protein